MASALQTRPEATGDEVLERDANPRAIAEDEAGAVIDPQGSMPLTGSPARSLLRFITCGSVDDGKSTLIGRLLYDAGAVFDDQLEALERDSRRFGTAGDDLDFALLVDGLTAEREQGITIDVAYRYFSTPRRSFIIADTPGHEQYTRNMATGASQAELAVILVDARKGILPQTRRHSFITSMVGIRSVIVAVNKMDLVGFDEAVFRQIVADYRAILPAFSFTDITFVPLSAKNGDNVTAPSPHTPWYEGETLLGCLEAAEPDTLSAASDAFRLPVQWVNRPNLDFRGFAGTIAGGHIARGDAVLSLPSRQRTHVKAIFGPNGEVETAGDGEAVTLTLADEVDASRGDVLVRDGDPIGAAKALRAEILWMVDRPLIPGGRLIAKLGAAQAPASVRTLNEAVDIHTFKPRAASALLMNEIGRVVVAFDRPPVATTYAENRALGSFILIDSMTNETVALGIVTGLMPEVRPAATVFETPHAESPPPPAGSTLKRVRAEWLGPTLAADSGRARGVTLFRALSAIGIAMLSLLLGLGMLQALVLGVADFALRPFLRRIIVPAETGEARRDPTDVGDGGGI